MFVVVFVFCVLTFNIKCSEASDRIIGGQPIPIASAPFQLGLQHDLRKLCGAVLIENDIALTAAHCIDPNPSDNSHIYGGSDFLFFDNKRNVINVWVHPLYKRDVCQHDIAVLKLEEKYAMSESIKTIKLADRDPPLGSLVSVTGWGKTSENGSVSYNLLQIDLETEDCQDRFPGKQMICVKSNDGTKGTCDGDAGGPLVFNETLVGIVCTSTPCPSSEYIGIFASVAAHRAFIKNAIEALAES